MDCPECKSSHYVKDGILHGRQRYRCKNCRYRYTVERKSDVKTPSTRRLAIELYLEGLSFREIGKILKISYGTVYSWVKGWRSHGSVPRRENAVQTVEMEALPAYIASRRSTAGQGLLLIDLEENISLLSTDIALHQKRKQTGK